MYKLILIFHLLMPIQGTSAAEFTIENFDSQAECESYYVGYEDKLMMFAKGYFHFTPETDMELVSRHCEKSTV